MEGLLRSCKGVVVYFNNILVIGATEEHCHNLKAVLQKLQETGLKLKLTKCSFFKKKGVQYWGIF